MPPARKTRHEDAPAEDKGGEWELPDDVKAQVAHGRQHPEEAVDVDLPADGGRSSGPADADVPAPGFPGVTGKAAESDEGETETLEPYEGAAKLRVEATTHVTLENEVIAPGRKVEVRDSAEARNCIAVGFLRLLDDDEELTDE